MKRLLPFLLLATTTLAQNPAPPAPPQAPPPPPPPKPQLLRTVPPPGIAITSVDRAELSAGVAALGSEIASLQKELAGEPGLLALLPDVQIFHKAVDWALRYDEIFSPGQVAQARQQLAMGTARAAELRAHEPTAHGAYEPSWNMISGADGKDKLPALVVRGYKSKIDGSIQPYGVVLPEDYRPRIPSIGNPYYGEPRPLHFWCHGAAKSSANSTSSTAA